MAKFLNEQQIFGFDTCSSWRAKTKYHKILVLILHIFVLCKAASASNDIFTKHCSEHHFVLEYEQAQAQKMFRTVMGTQNVLRFG